MTIEVAYESGVPVDEIVLVSVARYVLVRMRINPLAELSILLVDEPTMTDYHMRFMGLPGPTDVLSFPMDELRAPSEDEEPPEGVLGDIVICPQYTAEQAKETGRTPEGEADYLMVHGMLHLLGHDHAEPAEKKVMFDLNDALIAAWDAHRATL